MTDLGDFDEQVVHSGGTLEGLSTPGKPGTSTRTGAACTVCGSRTFENTSFGTWVCIDCGTASQDVRLATQDIDEGRDLASMRRTKRKRNDIEPVVTLPTARSAQQNLITAWMHIISLQCGALCGHLSPEAAAAFKSTVRVLVRRYLRWWSADERPGVSSSSPEAARHAYPLFLIVNGALVLPPSTAYASLLPPQVPLPWAPPISMPLTLSIALAASRLNHLPITSSHILQAAVRGHMPYAAAWSDVPPPLRANMTFAIAFFTPAIARQAISLGDVEHSTSMLAASIGVPLPPPNAGAVVSNWLHSCSLLTPESHTRLRALLERVPDWLPTMQCATGFGAHRQTQTMGGGALCPFHRRLPPPKSALTQLCSWARF